MTVHPFPRAVSPRPARDLIEARRVAYDAAQGRPVDLPDMLAARDRLEAHGVSEDHALMVQADAAVLVRRMAGRKAAREARSGTIRGALVDMAVLLAFGAAVLVVVYVGGPL